MLASAKNLLIPTVLFSILLLFPEPASADSCSNVSFTSVPINNIHLLKASGCNPANGYFLILVVDKETSGSNYDESYLPQAKNGSFTQEIANPNTPGEYTVNLMDGPGGNTVLFSRTFTVTTSSTYQCGDQVPPNSTDCPETCHSTVCYGSTWYCLGPSDDCPLAPDPPPPAPKPPLTWKLCEQIETLSLRGKCNSCYYSGGIWTAVGCIKTSKEEIASSLLTLGISLAGGFALLLMLFGAFTVTTSQTNPQRLQSGRDYIVSAILGLFFIILSIVILHFIGVKLLQIPGL